ncbi:MAG: leucine-rich repeat domain-containing protein, partial [Candidatus Marinimicrobia bacterium]|nr:leucine-rich repeat domain-containing protein [Candidatus Neomarinimicrobiota bacterium]
MRISNTVSAIAIVFIAGIIISCSLNPAEEDPEPIIVNFPDPNFEALIREKLEIPTRDITNQDMWDITGINGNDRNISSITGIEYCTGLHTLYLRENSISNLEPLRELVLLNYLNLQQNQIVDINPLVDNPGIGIGFDDVIYIYGNPLSDVSILTYKPQLQSRGVKFHSDAELSTPGIVNFMDDNFETVIREHLNRSTGDILSSELEVITNIYARNRNISNIYGIEFCINLDTLDIGYNGISDLIPLFYLRGMTSLMLDNNNIADISRLKYFYYLTELSISNNYIEDLSDISNLTNLKYLSVSGNPIDNFEPIENIDSLKILELMNLYQFDFDHIKNIKNLETIYLSNTNVINLNPIANITSLQTLIMKNCGLSNIDSLSGLNKLIKLFLNDNTISDISSLSELYDLCEVELGNNNISDILPLVNNWGISGGNDYVYLYNNLLS